MGEMIDLRGWLLAWWRRKGCRFKVSPDKLGCQDGFLGGEGKYEKVNKWRETHTQGPRIKDAAWQDNEHGVSWMAEKRTVWSSPWYGWGLNHHAVVPESVRLHLVARTPRTSSTQFACASSTPLSRAFSGVGHYAGILHLQILSAPCCSPA